MSTETSLLEKAQLVPVKAQGGRKAISSEEVELFLAYLAGGLQQRQVMVALGKSDAQTIYQWSHKMMLYCLENGFLFVDTLSSNV